MRPTKLLWWTFGIDTVSTSENEVSTSQTNHDSCEFERYLLFASKGPIVFVSTCKNLTSFTSTLNWVEMANTCRSTGLLSHRQDCHVTVKASPSAAAQRRQ